MGAILSLPTNKNQASEQCGISQVEARKKLRLTPDCNYEGPRLIPSLPDEISLQILARLPRICYLGAKMVSRGWKAAVTSPEVYLLRRELGVAEEWLYILTKIDVGKLSWHAFDPLNCKWQRLPQMPDIVHEDDSKKGSVSGLWIRDAMNSAAKITDVVRGWLGWRDSLDRIPHCGYAIGAADGCLYVLGGFSRDSTTKRVWRYDPRLNLWEEVSSMTTGRAFCKTSVLNNKLYVVGGVGRGRTGLTPLQSAEVYDPSTGMWTQVPSMPFSKAQVYPNALLAELLKPIATGMTSFMGKLYVPQSLYSWPFFVEVGGEIFDPKTNSWADMPAGMGEGWPARQAGTKLSAVVDRELYVLDPSSSADGVKIKVYDHQEDAWKVAIGNVPVGDYNYPDSESPYLLTGFLGKLHVIKEDINNDISIWQADFKKDGDSSMTSSPCPPSSSTCQNQDVSLEHEAVVWKTIATKKFATAELVSCQILNI